MAIGPREGVLLGANFGRAIVQRGLWGVCVLQRRDAALSQITLGRLVITAIIINNLQTSMNASVPDVKAKSCGLPNYY